MDYSRLFANRTRSDETNAIREILKAAANPELISLAGGLPAPEAFPVDVIRRLSQEAIDRYGASLFQYSLTEGFPEFRKALVSVLNDRGITISDQSIFVCPGSQSAIDAFSKVLINKNDRVAVEAPTYLAAIKTFRSYEAQLIEIQTDSEGIIPESVESILKNQDIKFLYIISSFQNPTGKTLSVGRRKKIASIIKEYNAVVLEDDPYYDLRYYGSSIPPLYTFAPENVVYLGSLSKVLSPGMRLGYYVGPDEITTKMTSFRQGVDVHASTFTQAIATLYINSGDMKNHIPAIRNMYKKRLEKMITSLETFMPDGTSWTRPDGGMFVWVEVSNNFNTRKLYEKAISNLISYVPGEFFFLQSLGKTNTMRLNFTNVNEENIELAIKKLSEIFNT